MRQALLLTTGIPLPLPANITGLDFIDDMAKKLTKEVKALASDQIKTAFQGVEDALQPNGDALLASRAQLNGLTDASYQALYALLQNLEDVSRPIPSWRPLRTGLEFVGPSRADGVSYAWVSPEARDEFLERGNACLQL